MAESRKLIASYPYPWHLCDPSHVLVLYPVPRNWAERAYPKLIHYNTLPKGGHFAAREQPQFLSEEVRAGFRSIRKLAKQRSRSSRANRKWGGWNVFS